MFNKEKRKISYKRMNDERQKQLGMPLGTARGKLNKAITFQMVQRLGLDTCFQCGKKIKTVRDLSIEHKISWLHSTDPVGLFFNLDNTAFSHLSCNCGGNGELGGHPSATSYRNGCRCPECKAFMKKYRKNRKERGLLP